MKRVCWMSGVIATLLLVNPVRAEWPWEGQRIEVDSTVFDGAGYHREKQELTLWFDNGAVYVYRDVPASTFELFLAAEAKGVFFHKHIRGRFDSDCRQTARRRASSAEAERTAAGPAPVAAPAAAPASCTRLAKGGA